MTVIRSRVIVCFVVLAAVAAPRARAQSEVHPSELVIDDSRVPRAAQASRTHLLGRVELYSVALYVADRTALASPDTPKALRIAIAYDEDPTRTMPLDWRRELVPPLEPAAMAHLRGTVLPLKRGDIVAVEYVPGEGTTIRANRAVVVTRANHDLMLAFLDQWLGQRPVSEEMKRALLESK